MEVANIIKSEAEKIYIYTYMNENTTYERIKKIQISMVKMMMKYITNKQMNTNIQIHKQKKHIIQT